MPDDDSKPSGSPTRVALPSGQLIVIPASLAPTVLVDDLQHVTVHLPVHCAVCRNFDPGQAAASSSSSSSSRWARLEYEIPAETPVGKIKIHPQDLIESANRGCMHCCIVQSALDTVYLKWETADPLVDIFLSPGLPVIVRLGFGKPHNITMGKERAAEDLSMVLHEGETLDLGVTLVFPKPAIEVEIYRPRIGTGQDTVGDIVLSALVGDMGIAEEISSHAGETECFDFIKENMAKCMGDHKCGEPGNLPFLPDRVVWIQANSPGGMQLLEPKAVRAKYIALSYCWGITDSDTYMTDMSNIRERKAGMQYFDLPPLFQDVIRCARALDIEYIWIDRLCIIQGEGGDFQSQAPKMGEIYGNATLTIAAGSAASENDRILVTRQSRWLASNIEVNVKGIGSLHLRCRRRPYALGTEARGGDYGKVSTRAWIWQERLLSARTVFYTPSALKFECHCHSIWEGFAQGITGPSWSARLENMSHSSWRRMVEEYTSRDISRPSDRIPAITSVMKRIEKSNSWSPVWGMWANAPVENLCWMSSPKDRGVCHINPGHYAPTWSWASVDGPVSFSSIAEGGYREDIDPTIYELEVRQIDSISGLIRVAGRGVRVNLRCRVILSDLHQVDPAKFQKFNYYYEIVGDGGGSHPIHADVPLKPRSDNKGVWAVRALYDDKALEETWEAQCLCVLVARWKLSSLVLLLGISSWEPETFERIGIASIRLIDSGMFRSSIFSIA